ncbi:spore germination protein [Cohnella terricola]|uniref:Spore germination protein n=1 Tax=Cohnella terricola TaxID=1289167 RepID=A0A559JPX9_9BACL|nr:spore germination protein [Cohnella terricola]TVY01927.1 spore germination protein [Cohnella terricola]
MTEQTQAGKEPWNESRLRALFANSSDVQLQPCKFDDQKSSEVVLVFAEGMCDSVQIGQVVLPELGRFFRQNGGFKLESGMITGTLPLIPISETEDAEVIAEYLFQGDLLMLFSASGRLFKMNICNRPQRTPEESNTEISIKGPKDGFTEDLVVNVGLIRKRIRSSTLNYEAFTLGRRTKTKVGLLYFEDILSPKILEEVRKRLKKIDLDGIYSINQLEEMLADNKYTVFPVFDTSGRPDFIVSSLLAGRFILIVDGIPMVLIGPATLSLIMKSPEDVHFNYTYVSFARIIRYVSLFLSITLPGIWVSLVAFHQDQIPFRLMATIAGARLGLPLSAQMELLILLLLLEIFREAGVRLPSTIGQTLTVVGGLIIGDASIRAGLVSPSVVVVGAITAVTSVTLVNQSLSTVISLIRLAIFVVSSFLGMFGLILSLVLLIGYLARLHSFGVSYLAPLSPLNVKDLAVSYLRVPWDRIRSRPGTIDPVDPDHQEGQSP